jgi:hypothetical protein
MPGASHFSVFVLVFLIAAIFILSYVLRARTSAYSLVQISIVSLVVVVGGMLLAKYGVSSGTSWWIYCGVPAALALVLPPMAFRMNRKELVTYLAMVLLAVPLFHTLFSFFVGWTEIIPYLPISSIWELIK